MSTYGTPHVYSPSVGNAATWNELPDREACECANCSWRGRACGCLAYSAEA